MANDIPACSRPAKASLFRTPAKPLLLPVPSSTLAAPLPASRLKRLSAVEMVAKKEKGRCLICAEKFSKEHLKTYPMKDIYLLQMDDSTVSDTEGDDDLLISLNAITGMSLTNMMQLHVRILDATLVALVDSRSMHSFISAVAARWLQLQPEPWPGLTVVVTNDDQVASDGVYRATRVFIGSEEFILNLFVIPLDDFDMVLGVQWLRSLGSILWDFDCCHMSC
jgi:hypothetical protein